MALTETLQTPKIEYSPLKWRQAWLTMDKNPVAIEFAKTNLGVFVLHIGFILALAASGQLSNAALVMVSATLGAIALAPHRRIELLVGASILYVILRPFRIEGWTTAVNLKSQIIEASPYLLQIPAVVLFLLFSALYLRAMRWERTKHLAKRPVTSLFLIWSLFLATAVALPQGSLVGAFMWTFVGVMVSAIWFLGYAAVDEKAKIKTPLIAKAGMMRPIWGGGSTPIGKGFGYLNKFDAKDADELAVTRLKAVKLVVWGALLAGLWFAMEHVARNMLEIPTLLNSILATAEGTTTVGMSWISLIYDYLLDLVIIAVWGHMIVAVIRMIGYRIPRNTRNPLASRTLAEFWNRYYFYHKELLVDFFFYPAFIRYFKKSPKLRIAFATFCAAGAGNYLFHAARDTHIFANSTIIEGLAMHQSAWVYFLALTVGLIFSQLNPYKIKPEHGFFCHSVLTRVNVCAFFCLINVFGDFTTVGTLAERSQFISSLFFI
jgi:hypothetical protein